jgi:hypothetical protein
VLVVRKDDVVDAAPEGQVVKNEEEPVRFGFLVVEISLVQKNVRYAPEYYRNKPARHRTRGVFPTNRPGRKKNGEELKVLGIGRKGESRGD